MFIECQCGERLSEWQEFEDHLISKNHRECLTEFVGQMGLSSHARILLGRKLLQLFSSSMCTA